VFTCSFHLPVPLFRPRHFSIFFLHHLVSRVCVSSPRNRFPVPLFPLASTPVLSYLHVSDYLLGDIPLTPPPLVPSPFFPSDMRLHPTHGLFIPRTPPLSHHPLSLSCFYFHPHSAFVGIVDLCALIIPIHLSGVCGSCVSPVQPVVSILYSIPLLSPRHMPAFRLFIFIFLW